MFRRNVVTLVLMVAITMTFAGAARSQQPGESGRFAPSADRNFFFIYDAEIAVPPSTHAVKIWIPLPRNDVYQRAGDVKVDSTIPHQIVKLERDGNRAVFFSSEGPFDKPIKAKIKFEATRREQIADFTQAELPKPEPRDGQFLPYLKSNRMIPLDGRIAEVSNSIPANQASSLEQARAIYDYIVNTMHYDKSGEGWGRGDAICACDSKRGNCTDFHSLFIALARSRGIPARFLIGFPLGDPGAGEIPGYHCWAEFYAGGVWVPVDASEASKKPARRNYYFGRLDADRIAFTMGRDLALAPPQDGQPVNFFIYPYVEADGTELPKSAIKTK